MNNFVLGVAPVWTVYLAVLLICIQLPLFRSFCSQKMDVKGQNLRDKDHRDVQKGTASGSHSVGTREKTAHFPLDWDQKLSICFASRCWWVPKQHGSQHN